MRMKNDDRRVGGRINDVIGASLEMHKGRPVLNMGKMQSFEGRYGYNGGIGCDVLDGPCSCGAWHHMNWKKCQEKVMHGYSSILRRIEELVHSERNTPLSLRCSVSLVVHQRQPSLEVEIDPLLEENEASKIVRILNETAQEYMLDIAQFGNGKRPYLDCYLEPDYRNKKKEFGFIV